MMRGAARSHRAGTGLRRSVRARWRSRREAGATMVEAALVTPLFMLIIFAVIELGPMFQQWSTGKYGANDAARAAAAGGSSVTADWDMFRVLRNSVTKLGGNLDYVIIYRAGGIDDDVPQACIDAAEAGRGAPDSQPVGAFRATVASSVITDHTDTSVETFDWTAGTAPAIACWVLYQRQFQTITSSVAFTYDKTRVLAVAPDTPSYSLNRFWPSQNRVDVLSGPQDYVGIYVQSQYFSPTGVVRQRTLRNTSISQIEPKRASR